MKQPVDPDALRAHCLELTAEATEHFKLLRDYSLTPGNAWLAKAELAKIGNLMGELDHLLEQIKQADAI